jgi:hypothetical protein
VPAHGAGLQIQRATLKSVPTTPAIYKEVGR